MQADLQEGGKWLYGEVGNRKQWNSAIAASAICLLLLALEVGRGKLSFGVSLGPGLGFKILVASWPVSCGQRVTRQGSDGS